MFLFEWFGYMISTFSSFTHNIGYAIILLAIVIKLFMSLLTKKYYSSIVMTEVMKPDYEKVREKYKDNPDLRNEKTMKFLMENGYPMMTRFGIIIMQAIFVVGICGALGNPEKYIFSVGGTIDLSFVSIPNIALSPIQIYKVYGLDQSLFMSILFMMAAVGLNFVHDMLMEKRQLVSQVGIDIFMVVAVTACSVVLSQGFMVYWVIMKLFDIFSIMITDKFFCVNIEEKRKNWRKEPKKQIKLKSDTKK